MTNLSTQHVMQRRTFLKRSALVLAGLGAGAHSLQAAGWEESAALPALNGFKLEGDLPNLKGKVVYLDFWASWCAPCKASFPVLDRWQKEFGPKGFTVLGINVDEKAEAMREFLKKTPVAFPVVRDAEQKLVASANVTAMPTSFLIDRKGTIRVVHHGFRKNDEPALAKQITALL
jgi:thiol-disulfide isomerase/thioredoxin